MKLKIITTLMLLLTSVVAAQEPRRDYVRFPIGKDPEALVKERLQIEQQLGPFKDLVRQILADPDKFGIDPKAFKDVKMDDPKLKKAVQDWAANDKDLQKAVRDWVKRQPDEKRPDARKLQKELKQIFDQPPKPLPALDPAKPVGPKPIEAQDDKLAKAAEKAMLEAEKTRVGDWLRHSDAWKRAFQDLRGSINNHEQRLDKNNWAGKFGVSQDTWLRLSTDTLKRLNDVPRPNLEKWQWKESLPGLGKIPTPDLAMPGAPTFRGPSLPSFGTAATWLLVIIVFLLAAWQLRRWSRRAKPKVDHRATLGPWPVRPDAVATRTDLVRAFDYLALWSLGADVVSWNHRAIALRWCEQTPAHADVARALAALYEAARYTDGAEELPIDMRDQARRALTQLAEVL